MWKPLAPVALLGKPNKSEIPRSTQAIKIEPLPLPAGKLQCKTQTSVALGQLHPFSLDHDYCLFSKGPSTDEVGNLWSARQQPGIIKSIELPSTKMKASAEDGSKRPSDTPTKERFQENVKSPPLVCGSNSERKALTTTGIVTPDASPDRLDSERVQGYSECCPSPCRQKRGRIQRKYRTRLPSRSRSTSSSSASSGSRSPPRKRLVILHRLFANVNSWNNYFKLLCIDIGLTGLPDLLQDIAPVPAHHLLGSSDLCIPAPALILGAVAALGPGHILCLPLAGLTTGMLVAGENHM